MATSMATVWSARARALPQLFQELGRTALAAVRREGPRSGAALRYARQHATAGDAGSVLASLDRFAREQRFLMNVGDEKGLVLDEVVASLAPAARVLELGCFCGYSAIRMARLLGGEGRVVSLETNPRSVAVARAMCELAGVAERVEIYHGSASELIPTLRGCFDLVFIDHWKDLYRADLERIEAAGLLRAGSVVVADNVGPLFGAEAYLSYVRECGRYDSRYVASHLEYHDALEDGLEISTWRGR
jgi:catechol O-methyltransferase